MKQYIITKDNCNQRIDKFLMKYLNNAPKSYIYKALRKKMIKLNSKKADPSYMLNADDVISFYITDDILDSLKAEKKLKHTKNNIDIVYEDENIIIINKKAGVLSQSNDSSGSLNDSILSYLHSKNEYDTSKESDFTPSICNRLDRNTTGIIIASKNLASAQNLNEIFSGRQIEKYYFALVNGKVNNQDTIKTFYQKDNELNIASVTDDKNENSKQIITKYFPVKSTGKVTLLKVLLVTGKSHQIRLHLNEAGFPIIGDAKYGDRQANKYFRDNYNIKSQLLHAESVVFKNKTGYLSYLYNKEIKAQIPSDFKNVLKKLDLL